MKTLGIDLGTNSLGWAIIDAAKPAESAITDAGVVIFEEGIKREKGNDSLQTPAAERRAHRMARRIKFRRRMRKLKILGVLIANGMCPLTVDELKRWKKDNAFPLDNRPFLDWLKSTSADNPYADRAAAAARKVAPEMVGRAIYHLAQRRGFRSSRKDAHTEKEEQTGKKKDERSQVKSSIAALSAILDRKQMTLGQHFCELYQKGEKVRGCYTGRKEHYEKEFDAIANAQQMDLALAAQIRKILFSSDRSDRKPISSGNARWRKSTTAAWSPTRRSKPSGCGRSSTRSGSSPRTARKSRCRRRNEEKPPSHSSSPPATLPLATSSKP